MAFGGGGSGFSFGGTNSNPQNTGFGAFGNSTNNSSTGFGSTSNTGFGSTTANANPFGGGSSFGSNTGGAFGSNTTTPSLFGNNAAKPSTFGSSTTGTSLFGNTTNANTGFGSTGGGLGAGNSTFGSGNTTAFGSNNASSTPSFSFGGAKPAFGASNTGNTLFGQGGAGTTGSFGSGTTAFGSSGSGTALGQQLVPPSDGTAGTPFNPTVEQDGNSSTMKNSFQSIVFQPPYQKYSFEELRLADYNAGRRFGNGSGQAGAFGSSTFGGFGASTNTGFGASNNNSTNPFGGTSSSSTLVGSSSTTGGFGAGPFGNNNAQKPGGLFGTQTSGTTGGGLFGTSNNTSTGFGSTPGTGFGSGNTGSSLFGGNNQNQAQKPGGLFGNTASTGTTGGGFSFGGGNNTSTGTGAGLFGTSNANTGGAFGATNQPNSNPFGNSGQNNQPKPSLFGSTGTGFGTSTTQGQSSGGLFGNTNNSTTGGGLFGNTANNNASNTGGGLFGNSNTNTGSGGLFGNNNATNSQAKPGLFGSSFGNTANTNTGSSLFPPANNTNQNQGGGLFGNSTTGGGGGFSFGQSNTNKPAGTSLFGNTANNNQSGGLFGSANNNNSGGLFGNSQNNLQNSMQQQDGPKHASELESSPFTQSSIWTGLPQYTPQNSAPLLTPLSTSSRLKENASKPVTPKLSQSRYNYNTPTLRKPAGFGFSYSTYGTPNSATSTPGTGGLASGMYNSRGFTGGSFGRSLHKSLSHSALRPAYTSEMDSILSPGAFTPGSSRYSSGSLRKLTIDRSIRSDLFSRPSQPALPAPPTNTTNGNKQIASPTEESPPEQPPKLKKRVSFDKDVTSGPQSSGLTGESGALVRTETDDEVDPGEATPRQPPRKSTNGSAGTSGKELAVVPEDRESDHIPSTRTISSMKLPTDVAAKADPEPGAYFMKPSRSELAKMSRDELRRFRGFVVGRKGCGHVTFDGPVDLTSVPLDDIFDKIVEIRLRSITVYPEQATKPPPGKGLNVPSTLYIENSWPRARNMPSSATSGPVYDKHINRLKKMNGTQFLNYDNATGVWTFTVPHYTRYGLDYDDDAEDVESSRLSPPPESLEGQTPSPPADVSMMDSEGIPSGESSAQDDTFAFKQKMVPGSFGQQPVVEYEQDADSSSEHSNVSEDDESDNDMSMAGTFPQPAAVSLDSPDRPILKSRMGTPGRPLLDLDGDWADQLQRTISPRKQNREALREVQSKVLLDRVYQPMKPQRAASKPEFRNSLDIMNSLFGKHDERMAAAKKKEMAGPDFEFPYSKRAKLFEHDASEMSDVDQAFHASFKPKWSGTGEMLHRGASADGSSIWDEKQLMEDAVGELVVSSLNGDGKKIAVDLERLSSHVDILSSPDGVPYTQHRDMPFSFYVDQVRVTHNNNTDAGTEVELYELAHVLFDDYDDEFTAGLTAQQVREFDFRIRKDRLTNFLGTRVWKRYLNDIKEAEHRSKEEAAIWHLTAKNVHGACEVLKAAKDYHLMMLVAQIESVDETFQSEIGAQIEAWREQSIISEISEPIRALYGILSGNTTTCLGRNTGPVEDRASTFNISERFGLDWLQTFCLGLWYGKSKNGSIQDVVRDFAGKLESGEEAARPGEDGQESALWVLLKLYASTKTGTAGVAVPVLPQALSSLSTPFDCRVTFQLHHALSSRLPKLKLDADKVDVLASELAFQLSASGQLQGALYALLHIREATKRQASIRDLLTRFAATLPDMPADSGDEKTRSIWSALTTTLKVPAAWIFEAKALFARSQNESLDELRYLLLAEQWSPAHECLCRRVAPRTVIDEDWGLLLEVLERFGEQVEERVGDWEKGGAVYSDFVLLVNGAKEASVGETHVVLKRLQASLGEMGTRFKGRGKDLTAGGVEELEERVACKEMSRKVAEMLGEVGGAQASNILDLPLTADARLRETRAVSVGYYRAAMVAAR